MCELAIAARRFVRIFPMRPRLGRVRRINCNVRLYPSYTNIQYRVFRSSDVAHIRCFFSGTYEYCWHSARRGKIFNMKLLIQYSPMHDALSSWWWRTYIGHGRRGDCHRTLRPRHLLRTTYIFSFFFTGSEKLGFSPS